MFGKMNVPPGLLLAWLCVYHVTDTVTSQEPTEEIPTGDCVGRDEELRATVNSLARQMMLQQLFVEEKSRTDGDSGLKAIRLSIDGTRPYHTNSHLSHSVASIHDHADHRNTVGMGELAAVLNGVEFRTRHNDYTLYKPSSTSNEYHAKEPIEYPDVPPAVLAKTGLTEQIEEMRLWFKAWQDEDYSVRDYRPYFTAQLCYLEGHWATSKPSLDEPFESDRHHLDAKSWFDLQEKIRYTAYHGSKDNGENLAYLPTTIISLNETTGKPVFAQFQYRIMCNPVSQDIPKSWFKFTGDLHHRYGQHQTVEEYMGRRSARFTLNRYTSDKYHRQDILDELMKEIPGKDNFGAVLRDTTFRLNTNDIFTGQPLNAAMYHRWYTLAEKGAMGSSISHRGFNDRNLFIAQNTRPEIAGIDYQYCAGREDPAKGECTMESAKVSYAIPLEIVYLTPLNAWNPYDIPYKGEANSDEGKTVDADGRNGGFTQATAYNGTTRNKYYLTPTAFYQSTDGVNTDEADTLQAFVGVLDGAGRMHNVTASGVRIHLDSIPGIPGHIRTRFPIMPVYAEGSTVWKELQALREMVMDIQGNKDIFDKDPGLGDGSGPSTPKAWNSPLKTSPSDSPHTGNHFHEIEFSSEDWANLLDGKSITRDSDTKNGHAHKFTFKYISTAMEIHVTSCAGTNSLPDANDRVCWDKHSMILTFSDDAKRQELELDESLG